MAMTSRERVRAVINFHARHVPTPSELEIASWIHCIRADTEPVVRPEQTFVVTQIIEALYQSAKENKPIYFKEITWDE